MTRDELSELHYITRIENVPSILAAGILSNQKSRYRTRKSIAHQAVQELRSKVQVPGGRPLHEYACLYFCARNPMMYLRKALHESTCVLRVSPDVLDLPNVFIADQNAASKHSRFASSPAGLVNVDREMVFAEDWRHPGDPAAYQRHKRMKCAEALVPDAVPPGYLMGAYVSGSQAQLRWVTWRPVCLLLSTPTSVGAGGVDAWQQFDASGLLDSTEKARLT
jgi:ssDNA thymidine ADP-ribosyltransferase, DarT